ncbi:MAG: hypothetical protein Q9M24_08540 [Mariprofundaceae bacterium]|nr:hypothetical protein [Mariprofundaceae bacterium]
MISVLSHKFVVSQSPTHGWGSLRAGLNGRSAVLRSLELAVASPALVRLAVHPVQAR